MLHVHTFSPVCVPINWQTELIERIDEKQNVLMTMLGPLPDMEVGPCEWPLGYGSLEHDNLPLFYQPAAVVRLTRMQQEDDVILAMLYCYDNCLAVLHVELVTQYHLDNMDDLAITRRIEALCAEHLSRTLANLYEKGDVDHFISPKAYKFYKDSRETLSSAKPLWVARMLVKSDALSTEHYQDWLQNVDDTSDLLLLGSGNSLLCKEEHLQDVVRVMLLSQFHAAMMLRNENLLVSTLTKFNSAYFSQSALQKLDDTAELHQYRNDHIEFINTQYSAAIAGTQGKRRQLLQQFHHAWQVEEQQQRIQQLAQLLQRRLNRFIGEKAREQARSIQTLLAFIGALSLVALAMDLASLSKDEEHEHSLGILDLFDLLSIENMLNMTILIVVLLTFFFYRNHE